MAYWLYNVTKVNAALWREIIIPTIEFTVHIHGTHSLTNSGLRPHIIVFKEFCSNTSVWTVKAHCTQTNSIFYCFFKVRWRICIGACGYQRNVSRHSWALHIQQMINNYGASTVYQLVCVYVCVWERERLWMSHCECHIVFSGLVTVNTSYITTTTHSTLGQ